VAGAGSNLASRQPNANLAAGGGGASTSNSEESETTYDYSRTHSELEDKLGGVTRLTVAATVDLTPPEGGQPPMTKEAVAGLIKQAIGYDDTRGDTIQVEVAKLVTSPSAPPEGEKPVEKEKEWWRNPEFFVYLRNGALALAVAVLVLVMLLIAFLLLRRTAPPVAVPPPGPSAAEREGVAERLATAAQRDPEALARAIAALMEQP
jgi:flagellar M-ring protein FliF